MPDLKYPKTGSLSNQHNFGFHKNEKTRSNEIGSESGPVLSIPKHALIILILFACNEPISARWVWVFVT